MTINKYMQLIKIKYLLKLFDRFIFFLKKVFTSVLIKKFSFDNFQTENIYVCVSHAAGDFLMCTEAINYLVSNYEKKIKIIYLREEVGSLIKFWFSSCEEIEIIPFSKINEISKNDLVISLCGPVPKLMSIFLIKKFKFAGFLYDLKIRTNIKSKSQIINIPRNFNHIRRNNLVIENLLNLEDNSIKDIIYLPKNILEDFKKFKSEFNEHQISLFLPQPKPFKAYPPKKAKQLIKKLSAKYKCNVIAYENDNETINKIFIKNSININLCLFDSWRELIKILSRSKIIICTDSVVYHICNAFRMNCIAIFGHTNFNYYKTQNSNIYHFDFSNINNPCYVGSGSNKYGKKNSCIPYCKYIDLVDPDKVVDLVNYLMER